MSQSSLYQQNTDVISGEYRALSPGLEQQDAESQKPPQQCHQPDSVPAAGLETKDLDERRRKPQRDLPPSG